MANYRNIHVKFWNKEWVEEVGPEVKLVFLYLITNPARNESGLYEVTNKRIAVDTGYPVGVVDEAMAKLEELEKVYRDGSWVFVVNVIEYTGNMNDKSRMSVQRDVDACPSKKLVDMVCERYRSIVTAPYQRGYDGVDTPSIGIGIGIGTKKKSDPNLLPKNLVANLFEELWGMYPRKEGKKQAERHFLASVKTKQDALDVRAAVGNYCKKAEKTEAKYIQQGQRFFNNWQDWVRPDKAMMATGEEAKRQVSVDRPKVIPFCKKCRTKHESWKPCPTDIPAKPGVVADLLAGVKKNLDVAPVQCPRCYQMVNVNKGRIEAHTAFKRTANGETVSVNCLGSGVNA